MLEALTLPPGFPVGYPTVLTHVLDRMMGDARSFPWDMYMIEWVQLTTIALLGEFSNETVHRVSRALHCPQRLNLDELELAAAAQNARSQRLLHVHKAL